MIQRPVRAPRTPQRRKPPNLDSCDPQVETSHANAPLRLSAAGCNSRPVLSLEEAWFRLAREGRFSTPRPCQPRLLHSHRSFDSGLWPPLRMTEVGAQDHGRAAARSTGEVPPALALPART